MSHLGACSELSGREGVTLRTGSDDTVLDDVSVRTTSSLMMFPLA